MKLVWDEKKRAMNLNKHGLDFLDADLILTSPYRMDVCVSREQEIRIQAFAYIFEALTVLTVVFVPREETKRIISFRPAKRKEREVYHEWLENEDDNSEKNG